MYRFLLLLALYDSIVLVLGRHAFILLPSYRPPYGEASGR